MKDHAKALHCFRYTIELLEDLHAGSGIGSVWVDRALARDGDGQPFIPASHVKGVWRDVAMRLATLGVGAFTTELIDDWFGAAPKREGDDTLPQRGRLYCPTLRPENDVESVLWMQTARREYSRRPADDTLRSTEYLPALTTMTGRGYFHGTKAEFECLLSLIARVDRYGGNRSRGDGRIRQLACRVEDMPAVETPSTENARHGVRLLLEALAPVQVPRTGSPGNIIESETRIPGRMLLGAITTALLQSGAQAQLLFGAAAECGDALPLAPAVGDVRDVLRQLEVMPAPLEYRVAKPEVKPGAAFLRRPPWADASHGGPTPNAWVDLLGNTPSKEQLKRLPAGTYLQRLPGQAWSAFRQPLELAMRNRRGSDVDAGQMDEALFSSEQIPAGTRFVADILPGDTDAWPNWLDALTAYVRTTPLLRIGRGGAPVHVAAVAALAPPNTDVNATTRTSFRLTLTSDAIIRGPTLGFHHRLSAQALCDALGIDRCTDIQCEDRSESRIDRAFNAATGLPRPSVLVIERGSGVIVCGNGADDMYAMLNARNAIGERQHEGMGRYRLDLDLGSHAGDASDAPSSPAAELRSEAVARFAIELHQRHASVLAKPSGSQMGNLRATLDALPSNANGDAIERIRQHLARTACATRGGKSLAGIAAKKGEKDGQGESKFPFDGPLIELADQCRNGWSIEDARLAFRLAVARIPRKDGNANDANDQDDAR